MYYKNTDTITRYSRVLRGNMTGDLSIVRDGHKVKIGSTTNNIYLRGKGGFGGNRTSKYFLPAVNPPKREPDAQIIELIDESQV